MRKTKKEDIHPLFQMFGGEYIQVVQDYDVPTQLNITEDGPTEMRMPVMVQGFLMDIFDNFMYLGSDGASVNQALPLDSIKHIEILEFTDEAQQILDDIPDPEDRGSYN